MAKETEPGEGTPPLDKDGEKKKVEKEDTKQLKTGTKLTTKVAMHMEHKVQMNMTKHNLSYRHFACRQFWFFTIPQAVLTLLSSVLAFAATTDLVTIKWGVIINIVVGANSGVVVFLQTMSGVCNYGTRAAMHEAAAVDLRELRDHLLLLKYKLGYAESEEKSRMASTVGKKKRGEPHPSPPPPPPEKKGSGIDADGDGEEDVDMDDTFESVSKKFAQSMSSCKSNVPLVLNEIFNGIQSAYMVTNSVRNTHTLMEIYPQGTYDTLAFKLYDVTGGIILNDLFFPLFLPDSAKAIKRATYEFRRLVMEYESFWEPLRIKHERDHEVEQLVDHVEDTIAERCFGVRLLHDE